MASALETDSFTSLTTHFFLHFCATTIVITLIVTLSLVLLGRARSRKNPKAGCLPPGPPALLFLAKVLGMRRRSMFDLCFRKDYMFDLAPLLRDLHARYGSVISLRLPGKLLIFISDRHLAHRLLVQGGATFADRTPPVDPASLFTSGGRSVGLSPYGAYWRLVRRNLAGQLQPARAALFAPAMRRACDGLIDSLLSCRCHQTSAGAATISEDNDVGGAIMLRPLLHRAMFELFLYMCFGTWLAQDVISEIEGLQHQTHLALTSLVPVFAFFPVLTKRLFRRRWEANVAVRRRLDELFIPLIHGDANAAPPSYADSLRALRVSDEADRSLTDAEMVSLCSEFLIAATDTTATLVEWIMAELVNHPDVQAKVREVVIRSSSKQPVDHGDDDIQYLKAVVLEGLRLHPPAHFVVPRGVQTDDVMVGGYMVPRGAEVIFLAADIGRDETVWTAAREFWPYRFLDGGEGCGVDITCSREIKMMPFGAGRRMCPGYSIGIHYAEYFVARMVQELEWRLPVDGVAVDMEEAVDASVVMKQPLRARIIARHMSSSMSNDVLK